MSQKDFLISILIISSISCLLVLASLFPKSENSEEFFEEDLSTCNVPIYEIKGTILPYSPAYTQNVDSSITIETETISSDFVDLFKSNFSADNQKAIVVEVDSPGGSILAGKEISDIISKSKVPVLVRVRGQATSAAYLAISSADHIIADTFSELGGIGVIASFLSEVDLNKREGYEYVQLVSAPYKDIWSVDKKMTQEEKQIAQKQIDEMHEIFVDIISENRSIDRGKVAGLANGKTYFARESKEFSLVDGILENSSEIEEVLKNKFNISDIETCRVF